MNILLTNPVFSSASLQPGRITQNIVDVMNLSSTFKTLLEKIRVTDIPIAIGEAGGGTYYTSQSVGGNRYGSIFIDPKDFEIFASSPQMLVARIGHEIAHAVDYLRSSDIVGADGLTNIWSMAKSPADYSLERGRDEGFSLTKEFQIAKELGLKNFSADPGVPGYGAPGLFEKMEIANTAMQLAGVNATEITAALTALSGATGRNTIPSIGMGMNAGLTYGQIDIKNFIVAAMGDSIGKAVNSENFPTSSIVEYWQNDDGSYRISVIHPVTGELITKQFDKENKLFSTTTATVDNEGSRTQSIMYESDGRTINQVLDSDNNIVPMAPQRWYQRLFSENVDGNVDGVTETVVSVGVTVNGESTLSFTNANDSSSKYTVNLSAVGAQGQQIYGSINDAQNQLILAIQRQTFDDGSEIARTTYASGHETVISTDIDKNSKQIDYTVQGDTNVKSIINRNINGEVVSTSTITAAVDENNRPIANTYDIFNTDGQGNITGTGQRVINPIDGSFTESLIGSATSENPNGTLSFSVGTPDGAVKPVLNSQASNTLINGAQAFSDAYALIKAIQGNKPLPAVLSGISLYNDLRQGVAPELLNAVSIAGVASSLYSFQQSLQNGDYSSAVLSGANTFAQGSNLIKTVFDATTIAESPVMNGISNAAPSPSTLAYLTVANDLIHGNYTAAAGNLVGMGINYAYLQSFSLTGPGFVFAIIATQIFDLVFGDDYEPWGNANAVWDRDSGNIRIASVGGDGGDVTASNMLASLEGGLVSMTEQYNAQAQPDFRLGVIPQRLGGINYVRSGSDAGFRVRSIDPRTGADLNPLVAFQEDGKVWGVDPSNPAYFQTIGQYYLNNALARQAIAPEWEVNTARQQAAAGLSNSGLSEVERAANLGHLAAALPANTTTEVWNPIALDLGGGLGTSARSGSSVQFNVDGVAEMNARILGTASSQYLKQTAWLNNQDGFLVLDKNVNGTIDNAEELFSNSQVNAQNRGIASLATWDADGNGAIDAGDAMFDRLRVWRDANGNGILNQGEASSLSELGIASLNYNMGTYSRNDGSVNQMATLSLEANTEGNAYSAQPDGIQINSTGGTSELFVTQVHDLSSLEANLDGFTTNENVPAVIQVRGNGSTVQGLLDNDHVSNAPNAILRVTGVQNALNGTVSFDAAAGTVTFAPSENFNGTAGFDYVVNAGAYGQTIAHVRVSVASVNSAPHVTGQQNNAIPIYGYTITETTNGDGATTYTPTPMYQPGMGHISPERYSDYGSREVPITYETDLYSGDVTAIDVDDANSALTWSVTSQAHFGTATIDNSGHWASSKTPNCNPETSRTVL